MLNNYKEIKLKKKNKYYYNVRVYNIVKRNKKKIKIRRVILYNCILLLYYNTHRIYDILHYPWKRRIYCAIVGGRSMTKMKRYR